MKYFTDEFVSILYFALELPGNAENWLYRVGNKNYLLMEQQNFSNQVPPPIPDETIDLSPYDYYYQKEFKQIIESGERYKGKWNWFAFLFSWMWCFSKGCWAYALVIIACCAFTYGTKAFIFIGLAWSLLMGFRGTWLYYNVKIKKIQFPKSLF